MDNTLSQFLDTENEIHRELLDLIHKGLVEYALSDETGELMFSLTDEGQKVCANLFGGK